MKNLSIKILEELESPVLSELDLSQVNIFGWERFKDLEKIKEMMITLKSGRKFPPVNVCTTDLRDFYLMPEIKNESGKLDGGHNRVLVHYLLKVPLPSRVYYGSPTIPLYELFNPKYSILLRGKMPSTFFALERPVSLEDLKDK